MNFTQETFDSYVKENIQDLDMTPEEAVEDAIETSKLQGGNLYFIIKRNVESDGRHLILHLLDDLLINPSTESLSKFQKECESFECRHWACMAGCGFNLISKKIEDNVDTPNVYNLNIYISALATLLNGQPDWVNITIVLHVRKAIGYWESDGCKNWKLVKNISNLVLAMSKMHEENRSDMMAEGIQPLLCKLFKFVPDEHVDDYVEAVRSTCAALQAQMVDDDNRKAGSDAHGRAKTFVTEYGLLENGFDLAKKLLTFEGLPGVNDIIGLLTMSLVCNDFCKQAAELGAGELAAEYMRESMDNPVKVKYCINLIKNLIGNDDVRHKLISTISVHEDVVLALQMHFGKVNTALAALRCITALTLRNPECARDLVTKYSAAEAIANSLNCHAKNKSATRAGLMATRNCVVRAPELRPKFLQLHVEQMANEALSNHGLDEAKACLRDLGCDVKLKEIWSGSGHKLQHASESVLKDMNIT